MMYKALILHRGKQSVKYGFTSKPIEERLQGLRGVFDKVTLITTFSQSGVDWLKLEKALHKELKGRSAKFDNPLTASSKECYPLSMQEDIEAIIESFKPLYKTPDKLLIKLRDLTDPLI